MYTLNDFFQPLNILTISYVIGLLLFFDILGTKVKQYFVKEHKIIQETRILNWLLGFSTFVFLWFLLGFFIEASRINLLISIAILFVFSFRGYKFINIPIKNVWPVLVLLIPFLPLVFVKASLPPYYNDELNYHFISPFQMLYRLKEFWTFNGGTLMNAPRIMDIFYILTFSLTHTYSVSRLLQFLIVPTTLIYSYVFFSKWFGKLSAFVFTLVFLSLPIELPLISTIGYVDLPAHLFMLWGIIFGMGYPTEKQNNYLLLSFAFWGMSIGTKYTSTLPFVIFTAVLFFIRPFINKILIIKSSVLVIIMGGYWYIKNFLIYGNPIYPFLFKCWGKYNTNYCGAGSSFFGDWTTPINLKNIYQIVKELVPGNVFLEISILIIPIFIYLYASKKIKTIYSLLFISLALLVLGLKYSSGFYLRYQQYLIFFILLPIVLIASEKFKNRIVRSVQYIFIALIMITASISYLDNLKNLSPAKVEKDYAIGKINVYDWLKITQPKYANIISWCEKEASLGTPITTIISPMESSQYIRPYLINCYWLEIDANNLKKNQNFWLISMEGCVNKNDIACKSEKILSNLYRYDYAKANK